MIQTNINSDRKERGFTIVELLVVIVVIGILAAITIVSYTGITSRANTAKAQSNSQSVQSVAEVYFTENTKYPRASTDFAATVAAKVPSGICFVTSAGTGAGCSSAQTALTTGNGPTTVLYQYCGAIAAPAAGAETGGRISFWDFSTSTTSTTFYYFGTGATGLGIGAGAVCNTWVTPTA